MRLLSRCILALICAFNNSNLFAAESPISKYPQYELLAAKLTEKRIKAVKNLTDLIEPSWYTEKDQDLKAEIKKMSFQISDFKVSRTDRILTVSSTKNTDHFDLEFINSRQGQFKLNGYFADYSKFKSLGERLKYIERILKGTKTSQLDFRKIIWKSLVGSEAQAVGPLVLAVLIAGVAGWGTTGYEICQYRIAGICTPSEEKINDALAGIKKIVNSTPQGAEVQVKLSCNGSKGSVMALDSNGDSILKDTSSQKLESMNSPTFYANKCCAANSSLCEQIAKAYFDKQEPGENLGGSDTDSKGGDLKEGVGTN